MKKVTFILIAIFVFGVSNYVNAQRDRGGGIVSGGAVVGPADGGDSGSAKHGINIEIGAHALVGLSSTQAINLKPVAPTKAGEGLDFSQASDESIYLQYSSINEEDEAKKVTVLMTDNLPEGVSVQLEVGNAEGGKGQLGSPYNGKLILDGDATDLISEIGSCYTGTGATDGHKLKYTLIMSDDASYGNLIVKKYVNEVTYTITDN